MNKRLLAIFLFLTFFGLTSPVYATYIADDAGGLWSLDVTTNSKTFIGNSGATMFGIALDPISGTLYGVTSEAFLVSINTSNAVITPIAPTVGVNGLTFDSSGILYGYGGSLLFTINTETGESSVVGDTGFDVDDGNGIALSSGNLFGTVQPGGSLADALLISINLITGVGTSIGSIGFPYVYGLDFIDSTLYGFTANGQTLAINTTTGTGTLLAINGIVASGATGVGGEVPVPEPSTFILLGAGLAGLAIWRKKRT